MATDELSADGQPQATSWLSTRARLICKKCKRSKNYSNQSSTKQMDSNQHTTNSMTNSSHDNCRNSSINDLLDLRLNASGCLEQVRWLTNLQSRSRSKTTLTSFKQPVKSPLSVSFFFFFILLLLLPLSLSLVSILFSRSSIQVAAYQLTNNMIANNFPPKFLSSSGPTSSSSGSSSSNSEIVVRVREGPASIGKLIYTLRADDPDDDPVTFGVLGNMASELLRIENVPRNQANVYLRKELDRETTESYQVVITLTDGKLGRGNWITKSMLIIVEDVNDNKPIFGPHRTSISLREDSKWPVVVETLEATDQDEGRFGQVIYRLSSTSTATTNSNNNNDKNSDDQRLISLGSTNLDSLPFSIETVDGKGIISLTGKLDYEQKSLYQLRIMAIDRATESERLSTSTSILITVEDCEDQPPMFTFVPSITRIPENLALGSPVVRVTAIDGDRGINNPIEYQLVSVNGHEFGPNRNFFSIDSRTGQVRVANELDREWSFSGLTEFLAPNKQDTNFIRNKKSQSLDESEQPAISGPTSNQPASFLLKIKATEKSHDQETIESSVTTELTIILTDVNDEAPTFNQATYHGEIYENSAPESLVNFVNHNNYNTASSNTDSISSQPMVFAKVIDRDQGTNGTFTLHLEGEHAHLFEIWPHEATNEANIMIKIASDNEHQSSNNANYMLDYERNKEFQFSIIAREKTSTSMNSRLQPFENKAQMYVKVRDTNDNYPQFERDLYRVEVPENAIKGMHICNVRATDIDSGSYGTAGIRYTEIRGEKANKLKLDPITGIVSLRTNDHGFDRESVAQYNLIIEARDLNGLGNRNTTQLQIVITDVNDQKPKFLLNHYEAFIYENELEFQNPPIQVQAIDNDAPNTLNSKLTYSIIAGDPQQNFTIDPMTGRIRVKSVLIANQLQLSNSSLTSLSNAGSPSAYLASSLSGNASLTVAQASGLDFESIAQRRDETRQFNLTIKASDSGLPEPLFDTTQVIIVVHDKNDHAPIFTRSVYSKTVREDAPEESHILQVLALDGDHSPSNSKITYRIGSGGSDKFVIDSESGLISVAPGANLDIDRAPAGQVGIKRTNYLLNVLAFDGLFGPGQKSASCLVNITIIDVNNKSPEFVYQTKSSQIQIPSTSSTSLTTVANNQQQILSVNINEDAPYGLIVTRLVAVDLDSNADLRYSINYARSEARNEDMMLLDQNLFRDVFTIDPIDGTIKVAKQLDRELFDHVKLRVQVEDIAAEVGEQIANTHLIIRILDINDNRPTFKQPVYKAVVNENSIAGTSIITITADDRDLNKTLRYFLDGPSDMLRLVRINPRSGEVTVNDKIDRELYPLINVTIRAEDSGPPHPLSGNSQLIINVRDENDNNPSFVSSANGQQMQQNLAASNQFYNKQSISSSSLANKRISDHISSGNSESHQLSGAKFRSLLPGSDSNHFSNIEVDELQLVPTNNNMNPSDPLSVSPSNANQLSNLPLLAPGATARIREDSPIGLQIAYVYAEDADIENNGRVTYIMNPSSSAGKFRIDRDTGIISVAGTLDREQTRSYSLMIEACDNYDLGYSTGESRRAFAQVNIVLTDVNDNAPVIRTNLQPSSNSGMSQDVSTLMGLSLPAQNVALNSKLATQSRSVLAHGISFDDLVMSSGPYDAPLSECLFINEFQALHEPILTITATDLDDPTFGNAKIDLAIVNNGNSLPSSHLFALVQAQSSQQASPVNFAQNSNPIELTTNAATAAIATDSRQDETENIIGSSTHPRSTANQVGTLRRSTRAISESTSSTSVNHKNLQQNMVGNLYQARQAAAQQDQTQIEFGQTQAYLVVNQSLLERVGNYSILVRATDRGQPQSLSSVRIINVCVQDVNNHAPVFIRPPLKNAVRVLENATIGSFVTQVEATDADYGHNGLVHYSLKQTNMAQANNDWQAFKIDKLSGVISTAKQFDRLIKKYYLLRVQAQDLGRPTSLSNDIDINIMIVNSGQYQPEFPSPQQQIVNFTENLAPASEWIVVYPTNNQDDEHEHELYQAENGSLIKQWPRSSPCYYIVGGDDVEQVFHLDSYSHRLTYQKSLDRESKANYTLIIQASNSCQQTSSLFHVSNFHSNLDEQQGSVDIKSRNKRETRRINPDISMVKSSSNYSKSSDATNQMNLVNSGDREKRSHDQQVQHHPQAYTRDYDQLLANDKSLLRMFIKVNDVNDNAPKFTQRVYTGGITTEADFGTVFMMVQAIDLDADVNAQVTYRLVHPIKKFLSSNSKMGINPHGQSIRSNSSTKQLDSEAKVLQTSDTQNRNSSNISQLDYKENNISNENNEPLLNEADDLFVINAQTGEISLNFDPQRHMKGYFEFEVIANDKSGLNDSAMVFIYLLRQDQRVKFVLRLTPQELRQRLDKFRSVFGNITGAIVNIDSYKYYENLDGTVDKKKTSLYLHFVNPDDNTIIEVEKVLTLIDNNIEYLDELYKEFHVLSSEAAHLPITGAALVDQSMVDQLRSGLFGIVSFMTFTLILVIALCLNQRTRYERQLKAASVSAFGTSPLHLNGNSHLAHDLHSHDQINNLPNTNLHSQDPNPIWINGFSIKDQHTTSDWLQRNTREQNGKLSSMNTEPIDRSSNQNNITIHNDNQFQNVDLAIETDGEYTSSSGQCSSIGVACHANQRSGPLSPNYRNNDNTNMSNMQNVGIEQRYNLSNEDTPRTDSSSDRTSPLHQVGSTSNGSSGSASTTNERQALCSRQTLNSTRSNSTMKIQQTRRTRNPMDPDYNNQPDKDRITNITGELGRRIRNSSGLQQQQQQQQQQQAKIKRSQAQNKRHNDHQVNINIDNNKNNTLSHHSTFGAFKEVTIYTDHQKQQQAPAQTINQAHMPSNLVRLDDNSSDQLSGQKEFNVPRPPVIEVQCSNRVNKLASHFNAQNLALQAGNRQIQQKLNQQARILVMGSNIETQPSIDNHSSPSISESTIPCANQHENNLNKLAILNLETTEL